MFLAWCKVTKKSSQNNILLKHFEYFNRFVPKIARYFILGGIIYEKTG